MTELREDRERSSIDRDLSSADEELRRLAVERLLELPSESAIPRLVECLGDASWRVRKAVVERIVACSDSGEIVGALIDALSDGDNTGRRNSAVEALVACGPRVVTRLVDALASDDVDVRKLLVDAIAGIGDVSARASMIQMLQDPDVNVRAAAADALGVLGGDESVAALRELISAADEDTLVRFSGLHALARLEVAVPVSELADVLDDPVLSTAGYSLLGYADDEASTACLLKGLSASSRACREAGMEALLRVLARRDGAGEAELVGRLREAAGNSDVLISSALERLQEADLSSRLVFIQFLGLVGDSRVVIPMLEAGRDEAISEVAQATLESLGDIAELEIDARWSELDTEMRRSACELLARTTGASGTSRLLAALRDSDSELRAVAASALGERRCIDALSDLVNALQQAAAGSDFEAEEEVAAIEQALVEIASHAGPERGGLSSVIATLAGLLDDVDEALRLSIATVLSQICREEDHDVVNLLQRDSSPQVRRVAVDGFERLAPEPAVERLRLALVDESPVVRIAAAVALGRALQPGLVEDLRRLIGDEDHRVRAAALRAIGAHGSRGDDEVRHHCIQMIAPAIAADGMVAMAAVEALGTIGGHQAAKVAAGALARPESELLQAAIACVGAHGDVPALEDLFPLLSHDSWAVRADAIQTLGERRVGHAVPPILRRLEMEQDGFVRDAILRALRRLEG